MEDYDIFNEMSNIKPVLMGIDKDNYLFFQENILTNNSIEFMPIRLSYNLDDYSADYIEKTKHLFIYYYDKHNFYINELLRIKKHFKHYQRFPDAVFIPNNKEYQSLRNMIEELNLKIITKEEDVIDYLKNIYLV